MDEWLEAVLMRAGFMQERQNAEIFALKRTIAAKDAEIARLREALAFALPFVKALAKHQEYHGEPCFHDEPLMYSDDVCRIEEALDPAKGEDKP